MNTHQKILERQHEQNLEEVKEFQRTVNKNYTGYIRDTVNRLVFLIEDAYNTISDISDYNNTTKQEIKPLDSFHHLTKREDS